MGERYGKMAQTITKNSKKNNILFFSNLSNSGKIYLILFDSNFKVRRRLVINLYDLTNCHFLI